MAELSGKISLVSVLSTVGIYLTEARKYVSAISQGSMLETEELEVGGVQLSLY